LYRIEQHTPASCSHFRKVFSKLNFQIPEDLLKKIVDSTAGYIEPVLCSLKEKIEEKRAGKQLDNTQVSLCEFALSIIFSSFIILYNGEQYFNSVSCFFFIGLGILQHNKWTAETR